ncbi:MAG: CDP-glycerol glycerophosphotransferase family protein [Frankiaceae bacterium]
MPQHADDPDVSVVVIVYNDARNLPRAVGSVLAQTLRNLEIVIVDDASTDDTPAVAQRLAAERPERIRIVRLPENSGGCSRPRNVGIESARGRYVMFLDSDDELDRHACKTMLVTAEDTGVDMVAGQIVRVHLDRHHRTTRWFKHVYQRSGVYASIRDYPELFDDMLSTSRCYRRQFLLDNDIRFPEGVLYEDSVFTTRANLAAHGIAVIPHIVYRWYVTTKAPTLSITNRRHEFKNFSDRIRVHRLIDELLDEGGTPDIRRVKDSRFLRHDLRLYLNELPDRNAAYQQDFLRLAGDYLDTIDPTILDEISPVLAIAAFMTRQRDLAGVLSAVDYLNRSEKLSTRLVLRDGRVYWTDRYLDTEEGRRYLDVTELGLHSAPLQKLHLYDRLTRVEADGEALLLEGEILNQLDRIPRDGFRLELGFKNRRQRGKQRAFVPAELVAHDGDTIRWRARVRMNDVVRSSGLRNSVWDVVMRITVGADRNVSTLTADRERHAGLTVPIRTLTGALGGDLLETYVTTNGNLAFKLTAGNPAARSARRATGTVLATERGTKARQLAVRLAEAARKLPNDPHVKRAVYERALVRLPIRRGRIVFESHLGKQYSDSPRRIYEEIRARGLPYECIWGYAGSPQGFPADATLVRRYSWRYLVALATAEHWVDNAGLPPMVVKRPEQTYVQTWHGTALKVMGFDVPSVKRSSKDELDALQRQADRWDYFLVRCEHDVETLLPAFRARAEPLRYGYPRNDVLVTAAAPGGRGERLAALGLPTDRRIVLYAPTFREGASGGRRRFQMPIDLDRFAAELGDTHLLLVRPHYLDRYAVPPRYGACVRNASSVHDVSELLAVADLLVTDYSSVMFDFAVTRRPMVFFTYDYDDYVGATRGTYVDLADVAPGPLVTTSDELIDAVRDSDGWTASYADRYARFVKRFAEYDDGHAAERVVDRFFGAGKAAGA